MNRKEFLGWLAFFALCIAIALCIVPRAHGQGTDNTVYARQFTSQGNTVGQLVTAAMRNCPAAPVPCIIVLDPSLAAWSTGTMPSLCSNCYLQDWRTGPPSSFPNPFTAGQVNGIFMVDGVLYKSIAAAQTAAGLFMLQAAQNGATTIAVTIDGRSAGRLGSSADAVSGFNPMIQLNTTTHVASFPVWPAACVPGGSISCIAAQYTLLLPGNSDLIRSSGGPFVFEQSTIVKGQGSGLTGTDITLEDGKPAAVAGQENGNNIVSIDFEDVKFVLPASGPGSGTTQSCVYMSLANVPNAQISGKIERVTCANFAGDEFHFAGNSMTGSPLQFSSLDQLTGHRTVGSGYALYLASIGNDDVHGGLFDTPVPNLCDGTGAGTDLYIGAGYQTIAVTGYQVTSVGTAIVSYTQTGIYGGQIDPIVATEPIAISGLTGPLASYLNGTVTITSVPIPSFGAGAAGTFTVAVAYGSTLSPTSDAGTGVSHPAIYPYSIQLNHVTLQGGGMLGILNGGGETFNDLHAEGGSTCSGVSNTQGFEWENTGGGGTASLVTNFAGGWINGSVGIPNATNTAPALFNTSGGSAGLVLNISDMNLPCVTNGSGTTVGVEAAGAGTQVINFDPSNKGSSSACEFQNVVPTINEPTSGALSTSSQTMVYLSNSSSATSLCSWTTALGPGKFIDVIASGSQPVIFTDAANSSCTGGNILMRSSITGCTSCFFANGTPLRFETVDSGTLGVVNLQFLPQSPELVHTTATWSSAPTSATTYELGWGTSSPGNTYAPAANTYATPFPRSGTVAGLSVWLTADPGSGNTVAVTFAVNGSGTAVTCTVTGNGSTSHACVDQTHSAVVTQTTVASKQGGTLNIVYTGTGLPSTETVLVTAIYQ